MKISSNLTQHTKANDLVLLAAMSTRIDQLADEIGPQDLWLKNDVIIKFIILFIPIYIYTFHLRIIISSTLY